MAVKTKVVYECDVCGAHAARWEGRCAGCGAWNTLTERAALAPARPRATGGLALAPVSPRRIDEVVSPATSLTPTGIAEFDRVLGGGVVAGSLTLVGGEPGVGKSTLALQALGGLAGAGRRCLLVSAEESDHQVTQRARRLGAARDGVWVLGATSLHDVAAAVEEVEPSVLAVDSVQTVVHPDTDGAAGSVAQVRDVALALAAMAKSRRMATLLVGHVTKDGSLAGPRTLEHLVDTVLSFEGDRHHSLRILRALKHRFGPTSEVGLFELGDGGLVGIADPGALLLGDRRPGIPGSVVVPVIEGQRPLLVELQALVAPQHAAAGKRSEQPQWPARRSAQGLDPKRLALLLAVLERRAGVPVASCDVYVSAVGGVRVTEPGADLGLALAVASSLRDEPVADGVVACAEVGLGGELRQVAQLERRLREAARLGFGAALVASSVTVSVPGMELLPCATLREALGVFQIPGGTMRTRGDLA